MSCLDSDKNEKAPCPDCGGIVHSWYMDTTCGWNPSSSGIDCRKCKRKFTPGEWAEVTKKFIQKQKQEGKYI